MSIALGLIALAIALLPANANANAHVSKHFFGITMGGVTDGTDLQAMQKIHVKTMRLGLNWSRVEPKRGEFRWPDGRIAAMADHGIQPFMTLFGTPSWATGSNNPTTPPLKGKPKRAWKSFLHKAVARYKPHGIFWRQHPDVPAKPVKAWQIWNEPNLKKYFPVNNPSRKYAKLVKASDKAISKRDRHAKVVLAGLTGNPRTPGPSAAPFLKRFYRVQKVKKHFNAVALHPYAPSIKDYKGRIKEVRHVMRKHGDGHTALWLTEVGWGSAHRDKYRLNKGLHGQARMLKKSFRVTIHMHKKWHVKHLYWFDWRDYPTTRGACSFCAHAGLLNFDRTHKPVYRKFRHFLRLGHHHHHHHHHRSAPG